MINIYPSVSLLLSLLYVSGLQAGNFGKDDRVDTVFASSHAQSLAESVPALIKKTNIKSIDENNVQLVGTDVQALGLCPSERFAEEKMIANCSGSLITARHVLTAAHCLDQEQNACANYNIVFGYARPVIPYTATPIISSKQIYACKKIIHSNFDMFGEDLAIIELDREVVDKKIVSLNFMPDLQKGDDLLLIGYPWGISQKVVEEGEVLKVESKRVTFQHNLDSFSSNSGGPIFNQTGEQVGVLVRSTVSNFSRMANGRCDLWGQARTQDFAEGNSLETIREIFNSL